MSKRFDDLEITSYELALQDVEASFDPLPLAPRKIDHRPYFFEADAARLLGMTKRALERRRNRGTGPAHHIRFERVTYYLEDLDAWVASKPKAFEPPPDWGE